MEKVSLKEKFWKTGNVFEFNNGSKRLIWEDQAIDKNGFIPKSFFNKNLLNTDSTQNEHVIKIYSPNLTAGYFEELLDTKSSKILWSKSKYILTIKEIREKLNIPEDEELIIIGKDDKNWS